MSAGAEFARIAEEIAETIRHEMERRAYLGANELKNAELQVIRGQGGGRRYRVAGTGKFYQASAPGQPPAVRTGAFRNSWQPKALVGGGTYISQIETTLTVSGKYNLGQLLEYGTSKMAPRPHHDKILEKAEPKIVRIYSQPYF